MAKTNFLVGLNFRLFGADLKAGYETIDDGGFKIFINSLDTSKNEGITFGKLIADVTTLFGTAPADFNTDNIKNKLLPVAKVPTSFNLNNILIKLQTVYLKATKNDDAKAIEYALRFDIITDGVFQDNIDVINVSSLTFAIWNIEDKEILRQLAISAS